LRPPGRQLVDAKLGHPDHRNGATEPPRVCLAGIDEQVQILRVSFVAVHPDREATDHHEADAMVLQQT
jgi:hypothetical protein